MKQFKRVVIIFNPNSTGPSKANAERLQTQLHDGGFTGAIQLIATQHAGHAEDLARQAADQRGTTLIVSSSGDGGYNEVINGAMAATAAGAKPVCAVLPSGNANDHRRTTREQPLADAILAAQPQAIDLIHVSVEQDGKPTHNRYAHSYVGLGLTPTVAVELNRYSLSAVREAFIVAKAFAAFQPLSIRVEGRTLDVDSLLISNIDGMAKIMKLAQRSRIDDGLLEVNIFPHGHKLKLLSRLIGAVTTGLKPAKRISRYEFSVDAPTPMQLDGEILELEAPVKIIINCQQQAIKVIV